MPMTVAPRSTPSWASAERERVGSRDRDQLGGASRVPAALGRRSVPPVGTLPGPDVGVVAPGRAGSHTDLARSRLWLGDVLATLELVQTTGAPQPHGWRPTSSDPMLPHPAAAHPEDRPRSVCAGAARPEQPRSARARAVRPVTPPGRGRGRPDHPERGRTWAGPDGRPVTACHLLQSCRWCSCSGVAVVKRSVSIDADVAAAAEVAAAEDAVSSLAAPTRARGPHEHHWLDLRHVEPRSRAAGSSTGQLPASRARAGPARPPLDQLTGPGTADQPRTLPTFRAADHPRAPGAPRAPPLRGAVHGARRRWPASRARSRRRR